MTATHRDIDGTVISTAPADDVEIIDDVEVVDDPPSRTPRERLDDLRRRAAGHLPRRPPELILAAAMLAWFATFALLVVMRHDRYRSFDFDLGIWDQTAWLFAHGGGLNTVRGINALSHHFVPGLYLYAPFYWLGAGPNFLNVTMVGWLCAGAIPVFRIAEHHLKNAWHALVPAIAFLVHYSAQGMLHETWHPEVMAIPALFFAYLAAVQGRWRAFAAWIVFALLWKEDVALAVFMLGAVLAFRGRRTVTGEEGPARTRRIGLYTMLAGVVYFLVATQVVIPYFNDAGNFTEGFFGQLGSSSPEIAKNIITKPDVVRSHLARSEPLDYGRQLLGSYGFVGVLSPVALLIGLPQALINLLTVQTFFWETDIHYAAMPLVAITIASVEGLARFRRLPVRRFLLGLMAVAAFFTAIEWGLSPVSRQYRDGYWPLTPVGAQARYDAAVALPGPDDATASQYMFTPHLSRRAQAYTFPNPWKASNWGVLGEVPPEPDHVDWIIVNPASINEEERVVLASAFQDPATQVPVTSGKTAPAAADLAEQADPRFWEVVIDQPDLLVARRVRA